MQFPPQPLTFHLYLAHRLAPTAPTPLLRAG
jgi:hypothetical protein